MNTYQFLIYLDNDYSSNSTIVKVYKSKSIEKALNKLMRFIDNLSDKYLFEDIKVDYEVYINGGIFEDLHDSIDKSNAIRSYLI